MNYFTRKELEDVFEIWEIEGVETWLIYRDDGIYELLKERGFKSNDTDYKKIPYEKWSDHSVTYYDEPYKPKYNFYEEVHKNLNNMTRIPFMISTTEY